MKVAIILAREGSKRIPKKNIKEFCGKPIIYWTITKIKESNLFDKIIVSTDSKEISSLALENGAEVPFIRPKALSDGHSSTLDVMQHAVSWLIKEKFELELVCCAYATSVFQDLDLLKVGMDKIKEEKWEASMSVTEFNYSVFRSFFTSQSDGLEMVFPDQYEERSQDLPKTYHDAAQFYLAAPEFWLAKKVFYSNKTFPVEFPSSTLIDIDTIEDWALAELIFKTHHMS